MIFTIRARREGKDAIFFYDNELNVLSHENGVVYEDSNIKFDYEKMHESFPFSPTNPLKKSKKVSTLKIQLGLSCNYSCEYCSQRYVERAEETSFADIDDFLQKINNYFI